MHNDAVTTTQNIVEANENLQSARDYGSASRLYILLFFVMAGLSLLFLDWFQP